MSEHTNMLAELARLREQVSYSNYIMHNAYSRFPTLCASHPSDTGQYSDDGTPRNWAVAEMCGYQGLIHGQYLAALANAAPHLLAVADAAQGVLDATGTEGLSEAIAVLRRVVGEQQDDTRW